MARYLYTVETGVMSSVDKDAALEELSVALRKEFPAFIISEIVTADRVAAVVVQNFREAPDEAWVKLNGWGNGNLTLELV